MADEHSKLTDFPPIGSVVLPGLGALDGSGLVVLVGPNSSGKSQLLQDIYHRAAGKPRRLVVATSIEVNKPPFDPLMRVLEEEGFFETIEDESGAKQLRPRTMYLGSGQPLPQIQPQQAQQMYSGFSLDQGSVSRRNNQFLQHFGRMLVTALFLDRRLTSLGATGVIDFETQSPQHDLHALYLNDDARAKLHEEMLSSFGRAVWPDMSRGSQMALKVSDEGTLPSAEDRLSHRRMSEFRSIESEGDGMKSYLATCVSLLLGRRPLCLIDEPEMCLHPPQAYNLGRFIGRYGSGTDTLTIVATHSSHLLRGILQTAPRVQIVRLTRSRSLFSAHLVPADRLTDALSRPTLKAESVLDGIFAQAVVVVEADGDRLLYQSVWETVQSDFKMDVHFTTVGGTGGIADTCALYRALEIPIAVIADLDVLVNGERMAKVLAHLVSDDAHRAALLADAAAIATELRDIPPTVAPEEAKKQLAELAADTFDWARGDDQELRRKLSRLGNAIDRMSRLKGGGVGAYDEPLRSRMSALLVRLSATGLFLVPLGELEQWLRDQDVGVSVSEKRAWANAAAQRVQQIGRAEGDVWDFVARVGAYLRTTLNKASERSGAAV